MYEYLTMDSQAKFWTSPGLQKLRNNVYIRLLCTTGQRIRLIDDSQNPEQLRAQCEANPHRRHTRWYGDRNDAEFCGEFTERRNYSTHRACLLDTNILATNWKIHFEAMELMMRENNVMVTIPRKCGVTQKELIPLSRAHRLHIWMPSLFPHINTILSVMKTRKRMEFFQIGKYRFEYNMAVVLTKKQLSQLSRQHVKASCT
jgi:hypothetical protein